MASPLDDQQAAGRALPHVPRPSASPDSPEPEGISWASMLVWIGVGFVAAGVVAYWLVRPFFAHH